jgi:hypothetical protein
LKEIAMSPQISRIGLMLLLALAAASAWGADARGGRRGPAPNCPGCAQPGSPAGPVAAGLAVQRAGDVTYIGGGIGETEQEQMIAREKEFNLELVFSLVQGNYVADVDVVVSDAKGGKAVEHFVRGPFFMAKLPAGQYIVAATYEGRTVTRKVAVSDGRLRTEYFRWPAGPEDTPVSRWTEKQ